MKAEKDNWKAPGCTGFKKPRLIENVVGAGLTDRRIQYWQDRGWYEAEAKQARMNRAKSKPNRVGNWVEAGDGWLIYCP